jgi:hypothetical protein
MTPLPQKSMTPEQDRQSVCNFFRLFRLFGHISTKLDVYAHGLIFGLPPESKN